MKIASIAPDAMGKRWILFHFRAWVYTVTYNNRLNSTAATRVSKCLSVEFDGQQQFLQYVYGQVHSTAARQVRNDYVLPTADDAEATVSAHVCNNVILNQPMTLRNAGEDELPS